MDVSDVGPVYPRDIHLRRLSLFCIRRSRIGGIPCAHILEPPSCPEGQIWPLRSHGIDSIVGFKGSDQRSLATLTIRYPAQASAQ